MPTSPTGAGLLAGLLDSMGVETTVGRLDDTFGDTPDRLAEHGIRHVQPRFEASAVQMAAAISLATSSLGVALVAGGRGVLQALPALADVQAVGGRVLMISTTRRADLTGPARAGVPDALDTTRITAPIVTWAGRVPETRRLPELLTRARRRAWRSVPGVVHLEIPADVLAGRISRDAGGDPAVTGPMALTGATPVWRTTGPRSVVAEAAGLLVRSARPLVHLGRGAVHSGAEQQVADLVQLLDCAVTTTFGARGVMPEDDRHVIAPVHPSVVGDLRMDADVVLVVGADLGESDWAGHEPNWASPDEQAVIQVDLDAGTIARNRPVTVGIVGDARTVLADLIDEVQALGERDTTSRRHWLEDQQAAVRRSRAQLNRPLADEHPTGIHPAAAVVATRLALPEDTTWVFDGGRTRRWAQFHIPALHPRTLLGDGAMPMAGAGLGLALGARLVRPETSVCCVVGDGALMRQLGEVATSVEQDLALLVVVLVDGDVDATVEDDHRSSRRGGGETVGGRSPGRDPGHGLDVDNDAIDEVAVQGLHELMATGQQSDQVRFDLVARALGAWGEYVTRPDQLREALARAIDSGRTAVVHVCVDRVEHEWSPEAGMFRAQRSGGRTVLTDDRDGVGDLDEDDRDGGVRTGESPEAPAR